MHTCIVSPGPPLLGPTAGGPALATRAARGRLPTDKR